MTPKPSHAHQPGIVARKLLLAVALLATVTLSATLGGCKQSAAAAEREAAESAQSLEPEVLEGRDARAWIEALKQASPELLPTFVAPLLKVVPSDPAALGDLLSSSEASAQPARRIGLTVLRQAGPMLAMLAPEAATVLQSQDPELRLAALRALQALGPEGSAAAASIGAALDDRAPAVRVAALDALSAQASADAFAERIEQLARHDKSAAVRQAARRAQGDEDALLPQ